MLINLTVAISIDAEPDVVVGFIGDPRNLALWAPAAAQLRLHVRVSRDFGTVDFLAADAPPDRAIGAYARVVPNGRGSEFIFTRLLPQATEGDAVARERVVLTEELETVRAHCEGKEPAAARIYTSSGPAPPRRRSTR